MTPLLVALGAMVGAPLRYLTDRWVQSTHDSVFPWGTFSVNVVGSFILGFLYRGFPMSPHTTALVGTGFCGALTTYSTFSFETVRLVTGGHVAKAVGNVTLSLAAGLAAATAGFALGALL